MNLLKISWKNVMSKPLDLTLSAILLAFGVGIISLLLLLEQQLTEKFDRNIKDIDIVLGAKGSPLQLILANVYHVDAPTGNIKVADAQKVIHHPTIKDAIPLAYGDNYEKWRIVGTTKKYPEHYDCKVAEGALFDHPFEATIGSNVAKQTGLKVGDTFESAHGLDAVKEHDDHSHDTPYKIVGIFEQSNSAIDNLILTPVESVWMIHQHHDEEAGDHAEEESAAHSEEEHAESDTAHDHDHEGEEHDHAHEGEAHEHDHEGEEHDHDHEHEEVDPMQQEMTAYLLIKRTPMAQMMLPNLIKNTNMQIAIPAIEMNRLSQNFGLGMEAMRAIAILIMILSFISVFISLYNSLKARKYELALMRTMGGTRGTLFQLIIFEGLWLVFIGFVIGMILSRVGLIVLSNAMEDNFHYSLTDIGIHQSEIILLGVTLLVGIVASLLPAVRAFRIDISKTLSNG